MYLGLHNPVCVCVCAVHVYSLVVVSSQTVLPQEHVGVAKVTVGSPPSPCVIQTICNREALCMRVWGGGGGGGGGGGEEVTVYVIGYSRAQAGIGSGKIETLVRADYCRPA